MKMVSFILIIVCITLMNFAMYRIGRCSEHLRLLRTAEEVMDDEMEDASDNAVSELSDMKDLVGEEIAKELKESRKLLYQAGSCWSLRRVFEKTNDVW